MQDTEASPSGFAYDGYTFKVVPAGVRITNDATGGSTVLNRSWQVMSEEGGGSGVLPGPVADAFVLCWPQPHVHGCRSCRMELQRSGSPAFS